MNWSEFFSDTIPIIVGAIIGGTCAIMAAIYAIKLQYRVQQNEHKKIAEVFFRFYFTEQAFHLSRLKTHRAINSGGVDFLHLDVLMVNYSMFERNKEHVVRLPSNLTMSKVFDLAHEVQSWGITVNSLSPRGGAETVDVGDKEARENVKKLFESVEDLENKCSTLANELKDRKN